MNNNFKKSLINKKINQLSINNILKEFTIDDKKVEINDVLNKTIVCNILKDDTISNEKYLITNLKESKMINKKSQDNISNELINEKSQDEIKASNELIKKIRKHE